MMEISKAEKEFWMSNQVPTAPPTGRSKLWLGIPGLKLLLVLALAVVVLLAGRSACSSGGDGSASDSTNQTPPPLSQVLPSKPITAVRTIYSAIARYDDNGNIAKDETCFTFFTEAARQQFAANLGYGDCTQAYVGIHQQVTDPEGYAASIPDQVPNPPAPDVSSVAYSSCDFVVSGGPYLGTFQLTEVEPDTWQITGHTKGPNPCPPDTPGGKPSLDPNRRPLPLYAFSFPQLLTKAIANNDGAICELFSAEAAQQFATGQGRSSCPAAIRALNEQVTDARIYGQPSHQSPEEHGQKAFINACELRWDVFGQTDPRPGPQIGRLEAERQAGLGTGGLPGFLIIHYRPC